MRAPVRCILAFALLCPVAALGQVQPHRAEYALRLGPAADAPRIGTAVQDLTQDCGGWHIKRDIRTEIALTTSWRMSIASKMEGDETKRGFRFTTVQNQNGSQREIKGRVQRQQGELRAEIVFPEGPPTQLVLPPPTLMPVAALEHLIERLRSGAASFPVLMFDAEVISDAFLVDVTTQETPRPARPVDRPVDRPVALPSGKSWPVYMTFTRARRQDQRPLFSVSALVFDNGVLDRLTVDTGLVSVTADLQTLDLHPVPTCPRS